MGTWGKRLYQNDVAQDVRDAYMEALRKGEEDDMFLQRFLQDYICFLDDVDDTPIFWCALADTQWTVGRLDDTVKQNALLHIADQRKKIAESNYPVLHESALAQLEQRLLSPQPPKKRFAKRRLYTCPWQVGDVFAFFLDGPYAKKAGIEGRWLLIQKIDNMNWHPGHIIPIVFLKITMDKMLPTCLEGYQALPYIQTGVTLYEHRFFPIDARHPKEDIAKKSKLRYVQDEYGLLPVFRISLPTTSSRSIPAKLQYIGNFKDAIPPKDEFVPFSNLNLPKAYWKTLEEDICKKYCAHTLRQSALYDTKN